MKNSVMPKSIPLNQQQEQPLDTGLQLLAREQMSIVMDLEELKFFIEPIAHFNCINSAALFKAHPAITPQLIIAPVLLGSAEGTGAQIQFPTNGRLDTPIIQVQVSVNWMAEAWEFTILATLHFIMVGALQTAGALSSYVKDKFLELGQAFPRGSK